MDQYKYVFLQSYVHMRLHEIKHVYMVCMNNTNKSLGTLYVCLQQLE